MKIYETAPAPNPRRVRMFLAEKAIAMDYVQIDIKGGENLTPQFKQKAATDKVPLLEFDDGSYLSETVAICRYFEETQPQPPLMGRNPLEKARIEMWQRRAEFELLLNVGMCFRNTTGYFKDRETPVPAWGEECGKAVVAFWMCLNSSYRKHRGWRATTSALPILPCYAGWTLRGWLKLNLLNTMFTCNGGTVRSASDPVPKPDRYRRHKPVSGLLKLLVFFRSSGFPPARE